MHQNNPQRLNTMEAAHDRKVSIYQRPIYYLPTSLIIKKKQDADRLARVRDNQRKSRARKQQYVKELEQRLSIGEHQAQQRDIEYRLGMQKVEAENRHLKTLLASLGISNASVQQYLQVVKQRENTTQKIAIPAAQRPELLGSPAPSEISGHRLSVAMPSVYEKQVKIEPTEGQSPACGSACGPAASNGSCGSTASYSPCGSQARDDSCGPASSDTCGPTGSNSGCGPTIGSNTCGSTSSNSGCAPALSNACAPKSSTSTCGPTISSSGCGPAAIEEPKSNEPDSQEPKMEDPDLCGCTPNGQDMVAASEDDLLNSTLCGIADEMINRYNTKGVDVEEIRRRIWSGFRAGANGTGCRVQNSVLFQVLDEISHEV